MTNNQATPTNSPNESVARDNPEVFIGLVGPIGTDIDEVVTMLSDALDELNYACYPIKISQLLHDLPKFEHLANIKQEEERYKEHMKAGTELRKLFAEGSALAQLAVSKIWRTRSELHAAAQKNYGDNASIVPVHRQAYIFNSLKNPEEVRFLRKVYGSHFYLLAIHTPREHRLSAVSKRICESHFQSDPQAWRATAEELVNIDENEDGEKFGQDVRGTYPEADYFIVGRTNKRIRDGVQRFVRLAFQHPFESPHIGEIAMFHAKAAAMRSSDLSRQVGAAVVTPDGRIISTGCNDVPKAGGGQYWAGDDRDYRDFQHGVDSNAKLKDETLVEILGRLKDSGLLTDSSSGKAIQCIIDDVRQKGSRYI